MKQTTTRGQYLIRAFLFTGCHILWFWVPYPPYDRFLVNVVREHLRVAGKGSLYYWWPLIHLLIAILLICLAYLNIKAIHRINALIKAKETQDAQSPKLVSTFSDKRVNGRYSSK